MRSVDAAFIGSAGRGSHPEHAAPLVGIGVTEDDAIRRALGLYAAAAWEAPSMRWASADELGDEALPVEELARVAPLETRDRIRWVEGFALDDGRPIWVPAVLVYLGLPVAVEPEGFWPASIAGLFVDDDLGAAVLGGLLDLVARDAYALAVTRAVALPRFASHDGDHDLFDATSDLGIPSVLASSRTAREVGMAAASTIEGARIAAIDDLTRKRVARSCDSYPTEPATEPGFADRTSEIATVVDDGPIDLSKPAIVARLRRVGLAGYAVDLTTDELARVGLSSVRVVVPGLSPVPPRPGWVDHARLARVAP